MDVSVATPAHLNWILHKVTDVRYNGWKSEKATPLPTQPGATLEMERVTEFLCDRIIAYAPALESRKAQLHKIIDGENARNLVCDCFWILFLEFYSLTDGHARVNAYRHIVSALMDELLAEDACDDEDNVHKAISDARSVQIIETSLRAGVQSNSALTQGFLSSCGFVSMDVTGVQSSSQGVSSSMKTTARNVAKIPLPHHLMPKIGEDIEDYDLKHGIDDTDDGNNSNNNNSRTSSRKSRSSSTNNDSSSYSDDDSSSSCSSDDDVFPKRPKTSSSTISSRTSRSSRSSSSRPSYVRRSLNNDAYAPFATKHKTLKEIQQQQSQSATQDHSYSFNGTRANRNPEYLKQQQQKQRRSNNSSRNSTRSSSVATNRTEKQKHHHHHHHSHDEEVVDDNNETLSIEEEESRAKSRFLKTRTKSVREDSPEVLLHMLQHRKSTNKKNTDSLMERLNSATRPSSSTTTSRATSSGSASSADSSAASSNHSSAITATILTTRKSPRKKLRTVSRASSLFLGEHAHIGVTPSTIMNLVMTMPSSTTTSSSSPASHHQHVGISSTGAGGNTFASQLLTASMRNPDVSTDDDNSGSSPEKKKQTEEQNDTTTQTSASASSSTLSRQHSSLSQAAHRVHSSIHEKHEEEEEEEEVETSEKQQEPNSSSFGPMVSSPTDLVSSSQKKPQLNSIFSTSSKSSTSSASSPFGMTRAILEELVRAKMQDYQYKPYSGRTETTAALRVLRDAGYIDKSQCRRFLLDKMISLADGESMTKKKGIVLAAIDAIAQEQDRIFSRISASYVALLKELSPRGQCSSFSVPRDMVLPFLGDALSQTFCAMIFDVFPYFRAELKLDTRRAIRKHVAFWFDGIDKDDCSSWGWSWCRPRLLHREGAEKTLFRGEMVGSQELHGLIGSSSSSQFSASATTVTSGLSSSSQGSGPSSSGLQMSTTYSSGSQYSPSSSSISRSNSQQKKKKKKKKKQKRNSPQPQNTAEYFGAGVSGAQQAIQQQQQQMMQQLGTAVIPPPRNARAELLKTFNRTDARQLQEREEAKKLKMLLEERDQQQQRDQQHQHHQTRTPQRPKVSFNYGDSGSALRHSHSHINTDHALTSPAQDSFFLKNVTPPHKPISSASSSAISPRMNNNSNNKAKQRKNSPLSGTTSTTTTTTTTAISSSSSPLSLSTSTTTKNQQEKQQQQSPSSPPRLIPASMSAGRSATGSEIIGASLNSTMASEKLSAYGIDMTNEETTFGKQEEENKNNNNNKKESAPPIITSTPTMLSLPGPKYEYDAEVSQQQQQENKQQQAVIIENKQQKQQEEVTTRSPRTPRKNSKIIAERIIKTARPVTSPAVPTYDAFTDSYNNSNNNRNNSSNNIDNNNHPHHYPERTVTIKKQPTLAEIHKIQMQQRKMQYKTLAELGAAGLQKKSPILGHHNDKQQEETKKKIQEEADKKKNKSTNNKNASYMSGTSASRLHSKFHHQKKQDASVNEHNAEHSPNSQTTDDNNDSPTTGGGAGAVDNAFGAGVTTRKVGATNINKSLDKSANQQKEREKQAKGGEKNIGTQKGYAEEIHSRLLKERLKKAERITNTHRFAPCNQPDLPWHRFGSQRKAPPSTTQAMTTKNDFFAEGEFAVGLLTPVMERYCEDNDLPSARDIQLHFPSKMSWSFFVKGEGNANNNNAAKSGSGSGGDNKNTSSATQVISPAQMNDQLLHS